MAQGITFQDFFQTKHHSDYPHNLTGIGRNNMPWFQQIMGDIPPYSVTPSGTYGKVQLRWGDGGYSGFNRFGYFDAGFNGPITFADAATFWGAHPTDPYDIFDVPFTTQLGAVNHLVGTLGILNRHVTSGGTIQYDFLARLVWRDPQGNETTVQQYASGAFSSAADYYLFFDAWFLQDDVFLDGSNKEDFPLYDLCLGVSCVLDSGRPIPDKYTFTFQTNSAGSNVVPSQLYSVKQIAANGYGRPKFAQDFSPEVGPASEEEGYDPDRPGAFDESSDDIGLPAVPDIGVSNVGFIRVYNTGLNSLTQLGLELFPPLSYTPPSPISDNQSVSEAIVDGFNQIVTFLANIPSFFDQFTANALINYVIDCHMIPVSPGAGTSEPIHVGYKELTTNAGRIYTDYVDFPCGSINVGEFYGNFADFSCTSAKLYLPFVGFVPTRPEWFTGSTLSVDYRFNVIDGSFTAYVRSGGKHVGGGGSTIVGQYAGNACVHLPITGPSYASMVSGLIGAGSGMVAGAASGNVPMIATSAIAAASSHGDIACSNAYNGSAAFLGCRYPFLMIERAVSNYAKNYQHEVGIPANVYATLGSVPGFVRMENVHVDGISGATEAEKAEIKRLLAQGVIV